MGVTSIRLQNELESFLEKLAREQNRSKNWLINQAIKNYIEQHQLEEQRWLETLPALESVKKGKNIPAKEVEGWLASWGSKKNKKKKLS